MFFIAFMSSGDMAGAPPAGFFSSCLAAGAAGFASGFLASGLGFSSFFSWAAAGSEKASAQAQAVKVPQIQVVRFMILTSIKSDPSAEAVTRCDANASGGPRFHAHKKTKRPKVRVS